MSYTLQWYPAQSTPRWWVVVALRKPGTDSFCLQKEFAPGTWRAGGPLTIGKAKKGDRFPLRVQPWGTGRWCTPGRTSLRRKLLFLYCTSLDRTGSRLVPYHARSAARGYNAIVGVSGLARRAVSSSQRRYRWRYSRAALSDMARVYPPENRPERERAVERARQDSQGLNPVCVRVGSPRPVVPCTTGSRGRQEDVKRTSIPKNPRTVRWRARFLYSTISWPVRALEVNPQI